MSSNKRERPSTLTLSEEEEERNADDIEDDDYDDEEEEEEEESEDSVDEDVTPEPHFISKHSKKTPEGLENTVCVLCHKGQPALFSNCNHFFCCYGCYTRKYAPAAMPRHPLPSFCGECEEQVLAFYYIVGSLENEELRKENMVRPKRRCTQQTAPILETAVTAVMTEEGYSSPDICKCKEEGCKRPGRYMAYHRESQTVCYTGICVDHRDRLLKECPICGKDVNMYYIHERVKK